MNLWVWVAIFVALFGGAFASNVKKKTNKNNTVDNDS